MEIENIALQVIFLFWGSFFFCFFKGSVSVQQRIFFHSTSFWRKLLRRNSHNQDKDLQPSWQPKKGKKISQQEKRIPKADWSENSSIDLGNRNSIYLALRFISILVIAGKLKICSTWWKTGHCT